MNPMDFNGGAADVDGDHNMHLAPHPHHFNAPQSAGPAQFVSAFRHHAVSPIAEHPLDAGGGRLHPSANLMSHDSDAGVNAQHMAQGYYQEAPRPQPALTPSTPSTNASPRFSNITPSQPRPVYQNTVPTDRSLPSRDITDDTIADTYATFILYCNPSFPLSTDTNELKRAFRTPPKSEGKSFSIYTLYDLIRRLDAKEIKTWTELALELGVERPDVEKGQSTQKVQQYTVRLKVCDVKISHIQSFNSCLFHFPLFRSFISHFSPRIWSRSTRNFPTPNSGR
jgi:ARS binding protein 2